VCVILEEAFTESHLLLDFLIDHLKLDVRETGTLIVEGDINLLFKHPEVVRNAIFYFHSKPISSKLSYFENSSIAEDNR